MAKYLQGAAFYLFIYLILGLTNTGIFCFLTRSLYINLAISSGILAIFTAFILYFSFWKSIEIFLGTEIDKKLLTLGWIMQFFLFIALTALDEKWISGLNLTPKLLRILIVLVNFALFFITYYFSVKFIVLRGRNEAG